MGPGPADRAVRPRGPARARGRARETAACVAAAPEGEGRRLTYDQYRSIRFDPAAAIWRAENRTFELDLLYPGFIFEVPVNINLVVGGTARRVLFERIRRFAYGPEEPLVGGNRRVHGLLGFPVRAPINAPDYADEFLVFQGASYFRAVAKGQLYGVSARGLAVRTARPEGEEFPYFTDFWIERPPENAEQIVVHALLQSPSVVGAYSFTARPGEETVVDVVATLYPRVELTAFGIAPLTSMFLFDGSNDALRRLPQRRARFRRAADRQRPRRANVAAAGESAHAAGVGVPRRQPERIRLAAAQARFADYQDAEAQYERRPSLWVEPARMGPGHVELVEIPSPAK